MVLACLILGAVVVGCGGGDDSSNGGGVVISTIEAPSGNGAPDTATPGASNGNGSAAPTPPPATLTGFSFPIAGGCLPKGDQLMPNAPRPYRNGIHEGVDFYDVDNCVRIGRDTPVVAAKPGTVIRADTGYQDITAADVNKYQANPNTEEALDSFRGRQVWVDHGLDASGTRIVTRYAHLNGIAPGINEGTQVTAGQLIAYVGESGTPESVTNPGSEMHLHFEIRVGASFLGQGQTAAQVRALYVAAFNP